MPTPARERGNQAGCLVSVVAALATGGAAFVLLSRAWATCDIGFNGASRLAGLVLPTLAVVAATALGWGVLMLTLGTRTPVLALGCAVLFSLLVLWVLMAWVGTPADYPAFHCAPDNVPPWWPRWLPV